MICVLESRILARAMTTCLRATAARGNGLGFAPGEEPLIAGAEVPIPQGDGQCGHERDRLDVRSAAMGCDKGFHPARIRTMDRKVQVGGDVQHCAFVAPGRFAHDLIMAHAGRKGRMEGVGRVFYTEGTPRVQIVDHDMGPGYIDPQATRSAIKGIQIGIRHDETSTSDCLRARRCGPTKSTTKEAGPPPGRDVEGRMPHHGSVAGAGASLGAASPRLAPNHPRYLASPTGNPGCSAAKSRGLLRSALWPKTKIPDRRAAASGMTSGMHRPPRRGTP